MSRTILKGRRKQLEELAFELLDIRDALEISPRDLFPRNFKSEKKKFFSSSTYNPQFRYDTRALPHIDTTIDRLWKKLISLRLPAEIEAYIESFLYHYTNMHTVRDHIGSPAFYDAVPDIYPIFPLDCDRIADTLPDMSFADTSNARALSSYEIQSFMQQYVQDSPHIHDIDIFIDPIRTHTITACERGVYIGKEVKRNEQNIIRIIVHEIESHILQKQNIRSSTPLVRLRTQYDRERYAEGLAIYNEIITGTMTKSSHDLYFHRLRAAGMIKKSFREIYTSLSDHMPADKAYLTSFRVKRGMGDTSQPGGWPKDAVYVLGYKAVEAYLNAGGKLDMLYKTQVPEWGELLIKYDLLPLDSYAVPAFHQG